MNDEIAIWWKRLLSNIIDIVIISLIIGIAYEGMEIGIAYAGSGIGIYLGGILSIIGLMSDMDNLINGLIAVVVILIFFYAQEIFFKRTIGKIILGLEIKTTYNEKPGLFVLFLRQVFKFIPFTRISLIKKYPIGLHNSILNLKVIDTHNSFFRVKSKTINNLKSLISTTTSKNNLEKLNMLFDLKQKGAISDIEYEKLKNELLGNNNNEGNNGNN